MKSILTLTLILIFSVSCGEGSKKSKTSFELFSGFSSSGIAQKGGVYLMGHKLDDSESFSIGFHYPIQDMVVDLGHGDWEFFVMGWQGDPTVRSNGHDQSMTGSNRCGYHPPIKIDSNTTNITFSLDVQTCSSNPIPGESSISHTDSFKTSDPEQFSNLKISSCLELPAVNCGVDGANEGLTRSYFVELRGGREFGNEGLSASAFPSLTSGCVNIDEGVGVDSSIINQVTFGDSFLQLPIGDVDGSLIRPIIHAFDYYNCFAGGGREFIYKFKSNSAAGGNNPGFYNYDGTKNTDTSNKGFHVRPNLAADVNILFIEHNPNTPQFSMGGFDKRFGTGQDGDVNIATSATINEYINITGFTPDTNPEKTTLTVSSSANFKPFDEVMLYVNHETSPDSCGGLRPGMFDFFRVKSIPSETEIELNRPYNSIFREDLGLYVELADVTDFATNAGCSLQLVRVPNYRTLFFSGGGQIKATNFTLATGSGGIVAFRVRDSFDNVIAAIPIINQSIASTVDTSACDSSQYKCANFGENGGGYPDLAGGFTFVRARDFNVDVVSTIDSSANFDGTSGAGGGDINFESKQINMETFSVTMSSDGAGEGSSGGDGGNITLYSHSYIASGDNLEVNTSGGTGTAQGGNAGKVFIEIPNITLSGGSNFNITQNGGAASSGSGGDAGSMHFNYCALTSSDITISVELVQTITAGTGTSSGGAGVAVSPEGSKCY